MLNAGYFSLADGCSTWKSHRRAVSESPLDKLADSFGNMDTNVSHSKKTPKMTGCPDWILLCHGVFSENGRQGLGSVPRSWPLRGSENLLRFTAKWCHLVDVCFSTLETVTTASTLATKILCDIEKLTKMILKKCVFHEINSL